MKLSIIIVTFNSENTIRDCIDSVIKTVNKYGYEIIVSDNSENNNTYDVIQKFYKENKNIKYFKNSSNLGFSKANNIAVKKSLGEFILFLNPDTKVYTDTIDGVIDFASGRTKIGVVTCFVELPDGRIDDSSHRGFPTPWRSFSHFSGLSKRFPNNKFLSGYNLTYLDLTKSHEIESAAGSFMLIPRVVGNEVDWWDEDYFFYGEDIDLCFRIKEKGYSVWFVPEFRALHMKGMSSGIKKVSKDYSNASADTKRLATHHRFKAMEIFYDKHYRKKYPKMVSLLVFFGIKAKKLVS